jgi:undecaprenyl diphosphate synthase
MDNIKLNKLPTHVAIIMDGNGRWAKRKKLKRVEGHTVGIESAREIITTTCELKIPYLTLYAFSKENWARPKDEVRTLLVLLSIYLEEELPFMMDKGIRFNMVGEIEDFPKKLQMQIMDVVKRTAKNKNLHLNIALSYSGRREIIHVVKAIVEDVKKGAIKKIDERTFRKYLYAGNTPDPDFLIRTSGEMRLSNFLLWQVAYTEIYVTDTLWPDFRKKAYLEALREFTRRERRFGKVREG